MTPAEKRAPRAHDVRQRAAEAAQKKADALDELLERVRETIDGAPMSDRSGATDQTRIAAMARALKAYEAL